MFVLELLYYKLSCQGAIGCLNVENIYTGNGNLLRQRRGKLLIDHYVSG